MSLQLTGIHHLTAITANAPGNLHFYTKVLGLRLVKKTVNQDDTSAYHLFYADGEATPGTDLTFFDWPVGNERRGTHSIVRTSLRVGSRESLAWWKRRLTGETIATGEIAEIGGYASLDFEDPEGQRLRLVSDGGKGDSHSWAQSPVPAEHQIRGLGPIVISVPDITNTEAVVRGVMNMRKAREYASPEGQVHVFEMSEGGPAAELHVLVQPGVAPARQGAGAVHHVAFRAPDQETLHQWTARLAEFRLPSSGEVERYYFRSLYFREPNGILFEIATDGPGFTADEPLETLGESLALPPFLEARRASIEAGLKPLK
ncbi:glyoxalase [Mesorhizobium sp. LNHC221B00]|uniref:ring-cleaving dioxygenase n=1 Tax=Mesorhizobium sp. LNHC221B00 TaxID=1287233 RepID=UPI0003CF879C|nr:ring-cleaving dioxygenase [Mesorhizobium sp. LNHC221B00]ESY81809.1 glyoxalase [Mesorhizobium sp. LNHC221B00]